MSLENSQFKNHQHNAEKTVRILELMALRTKVEFDRMVAARALEEAARTIPGDDYPTWCARLIQVGECVNLRIRSLECSWREGLAFVQQGVPVVTCATSDEDELQWIFFREVKGGKARIAAVEELQEDRWISLKKLRRMCNISSPDQRLRWIVGQPALPCGVSSSGESQEQIQPLSPLARLGGLMKLEKGDLWVILIFSIVVGVLVLATPIAVEALVNTVAFGRYLQPVIILALLLFTFLGFAAAIRGFLAYVVEIIQRRLFVRVVEDLAYRLPRVRMSALDGAHGPELVNRFFDIVTVQKVAAALLLDGVAIVLQTIIGMIVLAFYHPFLLGFDVLLLILIAVIIFVLGRGAVGKAIKESKAKYAVAAWLEELVRHPTIFKMNIGAQFALDRADQLAIHYLEARKGHFRIVMRQILFALGLQAVAATVLLGLGGWLVIQGQLTLGQLVAAELIVMMIVGSFAKLGKHMESYYDLLASVDKLGQLFDLPIEPHNKLIHLEDNRPANVKVCEINYGYYSKNIIKNLSFELKPGEQVALIGKPGSGKTTLIDLLWGVRHPTSGHIELDGVDLRDLRADALREHMAVVRGAEVFHGTIDENVHLNRPHLSAVDVRKALKLVGLLDDVLRLPNGLDTMLQTNGAPLSATQAQRLSLARAIAAGPRLLLIDGALDGLSVDGQNEIMDRLTLDDAPWTLFIATVHDNIIDRCQRVVNLSPAKYAVNQLTT